jgi:hypothetical protein
MSAISAMLYLVLVGGCALHLNSFASSFATKDGDLWLRQLF